MSLFGKKDRKNDHVVSLRTEQHSNVAISENFSSDQRLGQQTSELLPPPISPHVEVNSEFRNETGNLFDNLLNNSQYFELKEQLRKDIINDMHEIYDIVPKEKYLQEIEHAKDDLTKLESMVANEQIKFEQAKDQTSVFLEQMMTLTKENAKKIFEDIMNGKGK